MGKRTFGMDDSMVNSMVAYIVCTMVGSVGYSTVNP